MSWLAEASVVFAAEGGTAVGWLLGAFMVFVMQWGWLVGLLCLAATFLCRRTEQYATGCMLLALLVAGTMFLTSSVALRAAIWWKSRDREGPPHQRLFRRSSEH